MSVNKAIDSILEQRLDEMRTEFSNALTTKAVAMLEERKIAIAQNYFGQMDEETEQLDELAPATKKNLQAVANRAFNRMAAAGPKSSLMSDGNPDAKAVQKNNTIKKQAETRLKKKA